MYKSSLKSFAVAFFAMCLVTSCQKSVKGKWTDADKAAFSKEYSKETEKIVKTDANLKMFNLGATEIKAMSDCSLAKIEAAYTPAEAEKATKEVEKIGEECATNTLLGKKGAWSAKFKEMMKVEMNKGKEEGITPEQQSKLVECIISKAEKEFEPVDLGNSGAAMAEIGKNCGEEILTK